MTDKAAPTVSSEVIEAGAICSLEELCLACNVDAKWIAELVEYGVIEPLSPTERDWQFASVSIVRVAKAKRLERDLSLNPPGVALVLDLLQEIDELRSRLKTFDMLSKPDAKG
jgi:chaperone modulatory protein CbpM